VRLHLGHLFVEYTTFNAALENEKDVSLTEFMKKYYGTNFPLDRDTIKFDNPREARLVLAFGKDNTRGTIPYVIEKRPIDVLLNTNIEFSDYSSDAPGDALQDDEVWLGKYHPFSKNNQ
jgi:hypothetical protein